MKRKQGWSLRLLALAATLVAGFGLNATTEQFAVANSPGVLDTSFGAKNSSVFGNNVNGLAQQSDGKIVVLGRSTGALHRISADGTPDTAFNSAVAGFGLGNDPGAVAVQSDGKIVVADNWQSSIQRFLSNGTADTAFNNNATSTVIGNTSNAVAIQADGKILAGGNFTGGLRRLNSTGTADTAFNTNAAAAVGSIVYAVAVQSDGKIVVGGSFTGGLKRLNADGTADTTFNSNVAAHFTSTGPCALAINGDGSIIVGGTFTGGIKKFNADGTAGTAFAVSLSNVYAVAIQGDGKILAGGGFSAPAMKRFEANGTVDSTFVLASGDLNTTVNAIVVQSNGGIVVGSVHAPTLRRFFGTYVAPSAPPAPTALASDGQATVTVSVGAGVTPTSYTVTAVQDPTKTCTVTGAAGSCTVTGLTNGTSYTFTAKAYNTVVTSVSAESSPSNAVVPLSNPIYASSSVNAAGTELTITYSKGLSSTTAPSAAFAVTVDGVDAAVTNVTISGSTVVLSISPKIGIGQAVTLAYAAPASSNLITNNAVQNLGGEDAASLATTVVANNSTADITAPVYQSSVVSAGGSTLTLVYNEAMAATLAAGGSFNILANGSPVAVSSAAASGSTVVLTMATPILRTQTVTLSYTAPTPSNTANSNAALQDTTGNDAVSLTARAVTNSSLRELVCGVNKGAAGVGGSSRSATQGGNGCVIVEYGSTVEEFNYIGSSHTWTVPAGVTSVTFKSYGAGGGGTTNGGDLGAANTYNGGVGGYVERTYAVTPGQAFYIEVGAGGLGNLNTNPTVIFTPVTYAYYRASDGLVYLDYPNLSDYFSVGQSVTISGLNAQLNGTRVLNYVSGGRIGFNGTTGLSNPTLSYSASISGVAKCIGSVMPSAYGSGGSASNSNCATNGKELYASGGGGSSVWTKSVTPKLLVSAGGGGGASLQGAGGAGGGNALTAATGGNGSAGSGTGTNFGGGATQSAAGSGGGAASPTISGAGNGVAGASLLTSGFGSASGGSSTFGGGSGGGGYYGGGSGGTGGGGGGGSSIALAVDLVGPTLSQVTAPALSANGTSLVLTFDETLSSTTAAIGSFTVYLDGTPVAITSRSVSGTTLTLNLTNVAASDKVITVSYNPPTIDAATSNAAVQDAIGNDGVAFTSVAVTNNSSFGPDRVAPVLATSNPVTVSGTQVTVAFNEALLNSAVPAASKFTVFVAGVPVTPSSLTVSDSNVVLTLPSSVPANTEVIVSYEAPAVSTATTNPAVQDLNGNDAASFTQSSVAINKTWNWTTAYDAGTNAPNSSGCDGAGSINRIKQTQLPNGVYYSVGVTGANLCINEATESLAQRGGEAGDFTATGLVTEPGLKLTTSNVGCTASTLCGPRGTMTIYFSKPVKDPVVSFAGWGGGSGSSTAWTEMALTTPNVTMSVLSGTNIEVTQSGRYIAPIVKNPSISCQSTSGYGATAQAGCGSIQLNGTVTEVAFEVYLGLARGTGYLDAWNLTASISEDFGLVPTTYDSPVASHSIGDLRLGAAVAADQASALYATTNADAVARWTSLAGNAKADDGVADWVSSPSILFGTAGTTYTATATTTGITSVANLCAWLDFNRDEVFAYSERYCEVLQPGDTSTTLSWTVPGNVVAGLTYARVRLSYDSLTVATGKVSSGEVEDYSINILAASLPVAIDDASSGLSGATQTISVLANDQLASATTWTLSSLKLCSSGQTPNNCSATSVTVPNEGTYTVLSNGTVTFVPVAGFSGAATPIGYQVTDSAGQTRSALISPTVAGLPTATPNTTSGPKGQVQTVDLVSGASGTDIAGYGATLVASTVLLCDTSETAPNCTKTSVTVSGVGTYAVDAAGIMTFTPEANYVGTPTALGYIIEDSLGQIANSTYTPTVNAPTAAAPDTSSGPYNTAQTKTVLTNDTPASGSTLVQSSVKLCGPSDVAPDCTLTTLTVANEGIYAVDGATGDITFTPLGTFIGTATPVTYSVTDSLGGKAFTTYTPTVGAPPAPSASPNVSSGINDANQTINPLTNDTVSSASFPFDATTVKLCALGTTANCALTTLTVANEGTYTVNPTTGVVTFDPLPSFSGTATPITYSVTDTRNQVVTSTITPTVAPLPTLSPDTSSGPYDTAQTMVVLTNDLPGAGATLVAGSVKLCDVTDTAPNCTLTTLVVANEGTYDVDPSTGVVRFTPLATFTGTATPVTYSVTDSLGQKASTTYTPTVGAPPAPTATPDVSSGVNDANQIIDPLANDAAGAPSFPLDATSVKICALGTTTNCALTTLTVANEGTYTVNPTTGVVTFDPLPSFSGTATPITYSVADARNQIATSTITPSVAPLPVLTADTSSGPYNTAQTKTVLTNDVAGAGATLDATSVKLCGPSDTAPNCTLTTLTVANEGTYTVNATTGVITFTPLATFIGTATPVTYSVTDSLGQKASTTYTPTVGAPPAPTATPNVSSGVNDANQTINPLTNDAAGAPAFPLDATTVKLCALGTTTNCALTTLTVANEGTYTVNPTTGVVTYDPLPSFSGTATPITYSVADTRNQIATSTITPAVAPLPVLTADTSSGAYNTAQTKTLLTNDVAGAGATLDATSVKLCGPSDTAPNCTLTTLTVANEGTYTVNATTGVITFTPLATFIGTATPVTYSVTDSLGQKASTTYTPTVGAPPLPSATANVSSAGHDTNQTINPLTNDAAGAAAFPLDETSVKLCALGTTTNCALTTLTVANEGTYTVNPTTGVVTFDPLPTFVGTATPITYSVADTRSQIVTSTITPTVTVTPPTATPQTVTILASQTATFTALTGTGGLATAGGAPLVSKCLIVVGGSTCDSDSVIFIAGEGTFTLDANGVVTFVPVNGLVGGTPITPISYKVTDEVGQTATSILTVVTPPPPTATANTSSGAYRTPQVISPLGNDTPGSPSAPLVASTLKLCPTAATMYDAASCTLTTLTVPGEGTYVVSAGGVVTFTPESNFTGTATPIRYVVQDTLGQVATSTITPLVAAQPATAATPDTGSALWTPTVTVTINPLTNDSPGTAPVSFTVAGTLALNATSVRLCASNESVPNCTLTTLTTAEGTYTVNTTTGAVTFDPITTFTGTATIVPTYQICNAISGTWQIGSVTSTPVSTCASSTITPTITSPGAPTLSTDTTTNIQGAVQQINLLTNDNLRQVPATSVYLCGPSQSGAICSQTTLTVAGEGTYVINPTTGAISFTPVPLFVGTATPVTYAVVDILGGVSSTTYTPIVTPAVGPTATPETKSTLPSVAVIFNNITGTTPLATQGTGAIVPANTCLINPTNLASCTSSVTTTDGTWVLDPVTGLVTYTPNVNVTRGIQTPVSYRVTDIHGQTANSTLTPIVPAAPTASPDSSSGSLNQIQTLAVLTNDSANTGPALDPTTVKFCGPSDTAPNCTQTSLTVVGKGVFTVNPTTGVVTFTPATGFYGSVPAIDYSVTNTLGEKATSTITVVVTYTPTAAPDVTSGLQGATQTITLITNDSLAASPLATVALCGTGQTGAACNQTTITVANVGTYELDPLTGVVIFTPLPNYIGTPAALGYTITDTANLVSESTYTPTVTPIPVVAPTPAPVLMPPTAKPDTSKGKKGAAQSQNLFAGDEKGSGDLKTVSLCESVSNPSSCNLTSIVVAGVGSYALDPTAGIITFTPEAKFIGTAPPIHYTIIDSNGLKAVSTYTPTVTDVPKPTAKPDLKVGNPNQAVTVKPVSNDIKAEVPLVPTTIALCVSDCSKLATGAPNETPSNPPIATAQGVWTVNASTGDVTFMPVKNWFGRASIGYVMYDTLGNPVISKITVLIPGSKLPAELVYTGDDPVAPAAATGQAPSSPFPGAALFALLVAFVATRLARRSPA